MKYAIFLFFTVVVLVATVWFLPGFSAHAVSSGGVLLFSPSSGTISLSQPTPITLSATANFEQKVNVAQFVLHYPPADLTLVRCDAASGYQGIAGRPACTDQQGNVSVGVQSTSAEGQTGTVPVISLSFQGKHASDRVIVTMDQAQIVVKLSDGSSVLLGVGSPGTGTYSIGDFALNPTATPTISQYQIAVGTTNSLTISIGNATAPTSTPSLVPSPTSIPTTEVPANTPYIKFGISLFGVVNTPDVTAALRLTDLLSRITPAASTNTTASCTSAGSGELLYVRIPMTADSGHVYHPKPGGTVTVGSTVYPISAEGWVPLVGVSAGNPYAISVKAEKHRAQRVTSSLRFASGTATSQSVDWSSVALEPGDLPDPNQSNAQDCTVNSIDLSLISSRLGKTSTADLQVADINYDNIINGNDLAKVVHTLATKPDDEL